MHQRLSVLTNHALDFWLARAAVVVIVALQLLVSTKVALGPRWLAPVIETALLVPLSVGTAWTTNRASNATTHAHVHSILKVGRAVRWLAVFLTAVISVDNLGSLVLLIDALIKGHAGSGPTLLLDAVNIWATNLLVFALWFWNIDRSGPAVRGLSDNQRSDFLFSNMLADAKGHEGWTPGFVDYLYLSFTNSSALSPADTLPLSPRAKLLMMFESCVSLLTIAIVAARAINVLQ